MKQPLEFPYKSYEVGLAEFTYRNAYSVDIGEFKLYKKKDYQNCNYKEIINIDGIKEYKCFVPKDLLETHLITVYDGTSTQNVIELINLYLNETELPSPITFTLDKSVLTISIPEKYAVSIKGYLLSLLGQRCGTPQYYGKKSIEAELEIKNYADNFDRFESSDTMMILGNATMMTRCSIERSMINLIENMYIYTNIIEDVYVGSEMMKLLRIVHIPYSPNLQHYTVIYDFPHIALDSSHIDRIRLFVCDSKGNRIKFTDNDSQVIYKLHFRPKK